MLVDKLHSDKFKCNLLRNLFNKLFNNPFKPENEIVDVKSDTYIELKPLKKPLNTKAIIIAASTLSLMPTFDPVA